MKLKQAIAAIRAEGFSLSTVHNEYRVAPRREDVPDFNERELKAYYATDLEDAVATARWMRLHINGYINK